MQNVCVEKIISGGNTANICAIDLSKAFDKVNHFALFFKTDEKIYSTKITSLAGTLANRVIFMCKVETCLVSNI